MQQVTDAAFWALQPANSVMHVAGQFTAAAASAASAASDFASAAAASAAAADCGGHPQHPAPAEPLVLHLQARGLCARLVSAIRPMH
jgi:hypothetical protein